MRVLAPQPGQGLCGEGGRWWWRRGRKGRAGLDSDGFFTSLQANLSPLFGSCRETRNWLPFFKCFKSVQCQSKYIVKYDDGPYQFRHQGQERWREWKTWWHKVGLVEGRRRRERWRRWRARRGGTGWLGAEMEAVHFHLLRHLKVEGFCLAIQISLVCGTHHNHPSFSGNHVFTGGPHWVLLTTHPGEKSSPADSSSFVPLKYLTILILKREVLSICLRKRCFWNCRRYSIILWKYLSILNIKRVGWWNDYATLKIFPRGGNLNKWSLISYLSPTAGKIGNKMHHKLIAK